jgi:hypothetical protein
MTNNHTRNQRRVAENAARRRRPNGQCCLLASASANAIHFLHIKSITTQRNTDDQTKGLVRFQLQTSLFFTQLSNADRGGISASGVIKSDRSPVPMACYLSLATMPSKYTKPADTSTCDLLSPRDKVNWNSISRWRNVNLSVPSPLI